MTAPLFDLTDHFDTAIAIGDTALPVHIKRLSRPEMEALERKISEHIILPRGSDVAVQWRRKLATVAADAIMAVPVTEALAVLGRVDQAAPVPDADPQRQASADAALLKFLEQTITEYITLDEGFVRDRGQWVTTGEGLIRVFHARLDVLGNLVSAVVKENRLDSVIRKNSNSPRASAPGSGPSIPARGGVGQGSTVASAGPSTTVPSAAATDASNEASADGRSSSGMPNEEGEKVH